MESGKPAKSVLYRKAWCTWLTIADKMKTREFVFWIQQWWPQQEQFWWSCGHNSLTLTCLTRTEEEWKTKSLDIYCTEEQWNVLRNGHFCSFCFWEEEFKSMFVCQHLQKKKKIFRIVMGPLPPSSSLPTSLFIFDALLLKTAEEFIFLNHNPYLFTHLLKSLQGVLNCWIKSSEALAEHSNLLQFGLLRFYLLLRYRARQTRSEALD